MFSLLMATPSETSPGTFATLQTSLTAHAATPSRLAALEWIWDSRLPTASAGLWPDGTPVAHPFATESQTTAEDTRYGISGSDELLTP